MDARIFLGNQPLAMDTDMPYVVEQLSFDDLYVREYPALFALATALTGTNDSEDVVQDTMYKTLIHWNRVRLLERPGGWCHQVLMNICRNLWRRRRVEARFVSRYRSRPDSYPGPSAEIVAFWDAVRRLPTRPRMAVALYYAADRSTADVASILGVPEGTVRSDLSRARVVLASELRG